MSETPRNIEFVGGPNDGLTGSVIGLTPEILGNPKFVSGKWQSAVYKPHECTNDGKFYFTGRYEETVAEIT